MIGPGSLSFGPPAIVGGDTGTWEMEWDGDGDG